MYRYKRVLAMMNRPAPASVVARTFARLHPFITLMSIRYAKLLITMVKLWTSEDWCRTTLWKRSTAASPGGIMVFISLDELLPTALHYGHIDGHWVILSTLAEMMVMSASLGLPQ